MSTHDSQMVYSFQSRGAICSENSDNEVNIQNSVCVEKEIHARTVRQVYLITYGQADESRFQTRRSFVDAVLFSFDETPAEVT